MTLTPFVAGTKIKASETNANHNASISADLKTHGRQLIDRTGVYSADGTDCWGDAYIDANGRNDSVNTGNTTAVYNSGKYYLAFESTDYAPSGTNNDYGYTNPNNAFDGNDATFATYSFSDSSISTRTYHLGKTFSSQVGPASIKIKANWTGNGANASDIWNIKLEGYNGSTWTVITTLATYTGLAPNLTYNNTYNDFNAYLGYRVAMEYDPASSVSHSGTASVYTLEIRRANTSATIEHNIPSGTFSATISSAIGSAIYGEWESGASVQYKFQNTSPGEDSGWLTENSISTFTAFTSQPTKLIVKLNPKSSSPTTGYPSIKSFVVKAE